MCTIIYKTAAGKEPLIEWLSSLRDKPTEMRIRQRIRRLEVGQMGDYQSVGDGVFELRLFFGAGYRVYFAQKGTVLILLLCGGDKSTQERDIKNAKKYWSDYQENNL